MKIIKTLLSNVTEEEMETISEAVKPPHFLGSFPPQKLVP